MLLYVCMCDSLCTQQTNVRPQTSVADPNPDPPNPHVFKPPDPDPSIIKQKEK